MLKISMVSSSTARSHAAQMPKRYRPAEVVRVLLYLGWTERRGRGDHRNFNKPGEVSVVTVDMGAREVPTGTMSGIYRRIGVSKKEFERLAREA